MVGNDSEPDQDEREYLRKAHECLMNGGGYLGKAYREQVRRVRALRAEIERLKNDK